jgi:hypothetical protein
VFHFHNDYVTQRPNSSEFQNGWRTNNFLGRSQTARATVSPTSHTHTGWEAMEFENASSQKSGRSIVIDFQMNNIHTGRYVRWSR